MFLIPNFASHIASGTGEQSISTFNTLIRLAQKSITSMPGLTDVWADQLVVKDARGDGFVRNPAGFSCELYNGSTCRALNGNFNARRGQRSNMVVFDEVGWLTEELMAVYEAFTIVDKNLKLGGNIDADTIRTLPPELPNQCLYISSASDTSTALYHKYRLFAKKMIAGDPNYFVAQVPCDLMFKPTVHGVGYPVGLLSKTTVDSAMTENRVKAQREYYCQFVNADSENALIHRAWIDRNSFTRHPVLSGDGKRKFVMFFDPARTADNSVILVGELVERDGSTHMDLVNCISLADRFKRNHTPMQVENQIAELRRVLVAYNGDAPEWQNVKLLVDAGAGGGGSSWVADALMQSWTDPETGARHRGLIDSEYSSDYLARFPDAVRDAVMVCNPSKFRNAFFAASELMIQSNLVSFTSQYDQRGVLNVTVVDPVRLANERARIESEVSEQMFSAAERLEMIEAKLAEADIADIKTEKLSIEEEVALTQLDAMREEILAFVKTRTANGNETFVAPASAVPHDDRAYCLAGICWWLSQVRRNATMRRHASSTKNELPAKLNAGVPAPKRAAGLFS